MLHSATDTNNTGTGSKQVPYRYKQKKGYYKNKGSLPRMKNFGAKNNVLAVSISEIAPERSGLAEGASFQNRNKVITLKNEK